MASILVVDDEEDMRETIAYNLERAGHEVVRAGGAVQALERLGTVAPDLIISDVMMPGMDGLAFCVEVRRRQATALTPFLFVTARGQAGDKYEGLRAGADDYVTKPFDLADLLARVNGRLKHRAATATLERDLESARRRWQESAEPEGLLAARREQERIAAQLHTAGYVEYRVPEADPSALRAKVTQLEQRFPALGELRRKSLVGEAPAFLRQFEEILIAAASPDPTLVIGETGTGKTAVAEAIWALGPRAGRRFQTINCSELASGDPTIGAGKLFGYGRGSGLANLPREGQPGLLEEADGGVLFLDEIGDLPRQAQMLLLLPLEGRPFQPAVGSGAPRTVDVKFVCATNRDLPEEARQGRFPRDLYERLAGHVVRLPPLRERAGDVAILSRHLLREAQPAGSPTPSLAPEVIEALAAYPWPGNVRELRRLLRHAADRARLDGRDAIAREDLGDAGRPPSGPSAPAPLPPAPPSHGIDSRGGGGSASADPAPLLMRSGLSEREAADVVALRANGFRVAAAEAMLGYSSKSRTFSHRLRGLSLKALSLCSFDVGRAAGLLAGDDPELGALAARRLRSLLDGVAARLDEPDERLLENLLIEHRRYALEAAALLRRNRRPPKS